MTVVELHIEVAEALGRGEIRFTKMTAAVVEISRDPTRAPTLLFAVEWVIDSATLQSQRRASFLRVRR